MPTSLLSRISDGHTGLVFEYLTEGHPATSADESGVTLIRLCAHYGDVTAIKHLLFAAGLGELVFAAAADPAAALLRSVQRVIGWLALPRARGEVLQRS